MSQQRANLILDVIPRCMKSLRSEMREHAQADLTVPQFRVLVRLSQAESTNRELAEWLGVTTPTMSRMVDGLAKRDFIERTAVPEDRREVRLSLTQKGRSHYEEIRSQVQSKLSSKLDTLSSRKKAQLEQGLSILLEVFS